MTLVIGHANAHNSPTAARVLRARGCDSIGLNEADRLVDRLVNVRRYRTVHVQHGRDRRAAETPIQVRRTLEHLGAMQLLIADASTPRRIAPDRWLTAAMYEHPDVGPVAHVNVHLHYVGAAHDNPRVGRIRENDEAADALLDVCGMLTAQGFATVVTGDVNIPRTTSSPGWDTAWETFTAAGFAARQVGRLDAVAWDPRRLAIRSLDVLPAKRIRSDHPGAVATFTRP